MKRLDDLETPALVLDRDVLDSNLARMRERMSRLGVTLRPHVKTTKSIDILRRASPSAPGPITVSTLKEAEYFFEHGVRDILYAVGIAPGKLAHAADLTRRGADLTVVVDNLEAASVVEAVAMREQVRFPVLIELDVDGHRSGVTPESGLLLAIGRRLSSGRGAFLHGVMVHAGESYNCRSDDELRVAAERERAGAVRAAQRLRAEGLAAPVVSVGSTPTATFATDLSGVTEVRAGVYMLHDLVMAGIGVCKIEDIALSVLVSVIGCQQERGWIITDGGWMSLSRDRGTSNQPTDQGYGLVRDLAGRAPPEDLIVRTANQEHGIIGRRDGQPPDFSRYPVGTLLRILPNHACATAAQYNLYQVVAGLDSTILATWSRINGW
jgi:D-serine deaminase-like pyridoxal phosphate-dependent protein